jgi:hypothetical protein
MSRVTENQPLGTPTWLDLGVTDLDAAIAFYSAVFDWDCKVGTAEYGYYTRCCVNGLPVAALVPRPENTPTWNVYLATDDCDETVRRASDAGGAVIAPAGDVMTLGRMAILRDPTGGQFALWQGRDHLGSGYVNEPNTPVRNDLTTTDPVRAQRFYAAVFDFTLDRNEAMPELDFTFLRRPDGHEVAGIMGVPDGDSRWQTTFEVADTDKAIAKATAAGGAVAHVEDMRYGRIAALTDPTGVPFSVITRP